MLLFFFLLNFHSGLDIYANDCNPTLTKPFLTIKITQDEKSFTAK